MAKRARSGPPRVPLRLRVSLDDARGRIADRIEKGQALKDLQIDSWSSLEDAQKQYWKWSSYNEELLRQLFTSDELADEYARSIGIFAVGGERKLHSEIEEFRNDVGSKLHRLESISERLELIPLSDDIVRRLDEMMPALQSESNRVFIVHGHDEGTREAVARFLERLGLEPIILHEQPNEGLTVIEKLERYSDVRFGIVLLTPDDEGRKIGDDGLRHRARQNVILELGYFTAKLGRPRVCALHRGDLELPSDYLGVVYVPLDEGGGWQLKVAKELRAAGFAVDMNAAL